MTRVEDAVAAAECGADAIGMVLSGKSPRVLTRDVARQIMNALPPFVTPVGLFVNSPIDFIREITADLHLRHVQLYGTETPDAVAALRGLTVIKAVLVHRDHLAADVRLWSNVPNVKGILLETHSASGAGGTGIENDWSAIRDYQSQYHPAIPLIAAGGLKPENVAEVVRTIRPWAVDVSSGIESAVGVKSRDKMAAFVKAVQSVRD